MNRIKNIFLGLIRLILVVAAPRFAFHLASEACSRKALKMAPQSTPLASPQETGHLALDAQRHALRYVHRTTGEFMAEVAGLRTSSIGDDTHPDSAPVYGHASQSEGEGDIQNVS
jgi:hypothetical protein